MFSLLLFLLNFFLLWLLLGSFMYCFLPGLIIRIWREWVKCILLDKTLQKKITEYIQDAMYDKSSSLYSLLEREIGTMINNLLDNKFYLVGKFVSEKTRTEIKVYIIRIIAEKSRSLLDKICPGLGLKIVESRIRKGIVTYMKKNKWQVIKWSGMVALFCVSLEWIVLSITRLFYDV